MRRITWKTPALSLLGLILLTGVVSAETWTFWRGPQGTGVSSATGLVSSWSKDGENLLWRDDFTGRSTPVVFDGRVCAIGRVGEDILRQETIVCWDVETGKRLWERRFNVYHTAVPWNRVGWGDVTADDETGYVFAQGVNGRLICLDRNGETVWEWTLYEDLGRFSGYGGRTNTPIVDGDQLLVHVIGAAWGKDIGPAGDRWFSFDKRTGEVLWITERGDRLKDLNTYSTPVVAEVDGQRLLIGGGADGWIRAFKAGTGEAVWRFHLSQRGLNSSVVVDDERVFASHSEENIDSGVMGRLVAIDAKGSGDITKTNEIWRIESMMAGYASAGIKHGKLYVVDNSANLYAFDAKTGEELWEHNFGTVGKGSPLLADGKIFLTEVNGNIHILKENEDGVTVLDEEHLEMPYGRYAEIYASPAVGYGRLFFITEEGIYAVGAKNQPVEKSAEVTAKKPEKGDSKAKPAVIRVVPAVVTGRADEPRTFHVRAFDDKGRFLREVEAEWSLAGLPGKIAGGKLTLDAKAIQGTAIGTVTAKVGDLSHTAHVRVAGELPWSEDFENIAIGEAPAAWLGKGKGANVQEVDGSKVLVQPKAARGAPRASLLMGPSYLEDYTIQADMKATQKGRRKADVGLINSGYIVDLQGNHQRIEIRSWASELRMAKKFPFEWEMDTWYTMKVRVDDENDKAIIRAKIWKRGEAEPGDWTVSLEDPLPIRHGSPGLYTFAPVDAFFDNVKVTVSR